MNERMETLMTSRSSSASSDQSFANRVVLITGGSTGIGAAAAAHFARSGARVVITGRTEATLTAAAAQHPNISSVVADAARAEDSARVLPESGDFLLWPTLERRTVADLRRCFSNTLANTA